MKPFVYKNITGTFFDALTVPDSANTQGMEAARGATTRQDAVICALSGELALATLPEFAASLRKLLTSTVQVIVLDLSRVRLFCPNAVSVLVNFVSFAEGGGKRLVVFRPSRCVKEALHSLGLEHLFEIRETEEDLLLVIPD